MSDVEAATAAESYSPGSYLPLAMQIVNWVGILTALVVISIFADSITHAIVGKHTSFDLSLSISIGIDIAGVVGVIAFFSRSNYYRQAAIYARQQAQLLEQENTALRHELQRHGVPLPPGSVPAPPYRPNSRRRRPGANR